MTISKFTIEYDSINDQNIFTNGDTITGRIIAVTSGKTKVESLTFTAKGKASVCWSEHYGQYNTVVYHDKEKYYKVERSILADPLEIGPGRHVFPFTFQIPNRSMPSSFKTYTGKVVHSLEAKLSRSMKIPSQAKTKFTFISKADMNLPGLLEPQYGSKDKDVVFFASGNVSMNIFTEKMGYLQGEPLNVTVEVVNSSTCSVKPKFKLYEKKSYFGKGIYGQKRRVETSTILKDKDESVEKSSRRTLCKNFCVPRELPPSILNCKIIKLEYRLKVILDVALTKNPEIKIPIVVLPYLNDCWSSSKALEAYKH